eukprot:TRINITY_DN1055_c0_g3_i2.p2 TRINITY_DN1055_c0_g3~~TRINITY_DN1055_c0_g3_i2.p2  ORF type:complete len:129 (+),score=8.60 TRINITY_DN1055_c0_g3_i2:180-566(+)
MMIKKQNNDIALFFLSLEKNSTRYMVEDNKFKRGLGLLGLLILIVVSVKANRCDDKDLGLATFRKLTADEVFKSAEKLTPRFNKLMGDEGCFLRGRMGGFKRLTCSHGPDQGFRSISRSFPSSQGYVR